MNFVSFGPDDVRAVFRGEKPRCTMAVLTCETCCEKCWYAVDETCRCSCGGKNHGCLLVDGAKQPVRTARIDGQMYRLVAVGEGALKHAEELNRRQWKSVEKPLRDMNGTSIQYKYRWRETDAGAPARVKWATKEQVERWPELAAFKGKNRPCLCWEIEQWPTAPTEPVIE